MTWKIGYSVANKLNGITIRFNENAKISKETTSQISGSSRRMAEAASEQAASLEESAATIQSSATAAQQIKEVSKETTVAAQQGSAEMGSMIAATLKTIDEIAFQTNILALNAAVEAARAGKAGAGFAVVADEDRTLAQRGAKAARETSERIEESTQRSQAGLQTSERVAGVLEKTCSKAFEMDELMRNMATSSQEQSAGSAQLNIALTQMDQVTLDNAASAEETASATLPLDPLTNKLHQMIGDLSDIVGIENLNPSGTISRASSPARRAYNGPWEIDTRQHSGDSFWNTLEN